MKKKTFTGILLLCILVFVTCFVGIKVNQQQEVETNNKPNDKPNVEFEDTLGDFGTIDRPFDQLVDIRKNNTPYDQSHLLAKIDYVKFEKTNFNILDSFGVSTIEEHKFSDWVTINLKPNINAKDAIYNLRSLDCFTLVDFDYIYKSNGFEDEKTIPVENNVSQSLNLPEAYKYMEKNNVSAGGTNDTVVAVLDTGVDYNHIDLKDNIWENPLEIPDNNIDDDNNGYVDDVRGWNVVFGNNDPMDDNGHGTHVAGIIGAAKNNIGTTGIAYNVKIMPVKCGSSSNVFNNSWIAEAITYAYMNGADIISMSIGGSSISLEVQEALKKAYTTSFLVAAAGNDTAQNQFRFSGYDVIPTFPAAYPFVCGVMSQGFADYESGFTNFDAFPNNEVEYEVFALGEYVKSTFPNNKYAILNGTSMATPVVSGVAALIRSMHPDKEQYPTKYLFSQITNTSKKGILLYHPARFDGVAKGLDAYAALSQPSTPNIYLSDHFTFDNKEYASFNNSNGVINNGETIRSGIELKNLGGAAYNTVAKINVNRSAVTVDPCVNIIKDTIEFGEVGIYSAKNTNIIYDDNDIAIDTELYFEYEIAKNTPDEYPITFNLIVEYDDKPTNGKHYVKELSFMISVSNRVLLPSFVDKDLTLTADQSYILVDRMVIDKNVTLTIEPGVDIQMYNDINSEIYGEQINTPIIVVWGTLNCIGSEDNYINIHNADWYMEYAWQITTVGDGVVNFEYTNIYNPTNILDINSYTKANINIKQCNVTYYCISESSLRKISNGRHESYYGCKFIINSVENTNVTFRSNIYFEADKITNSTLSIFENPGYSTGGSWNWYPPRVYAFKEASNNIFINNIELSRIPFEIHFSIEDGTEIYKNNTFVLTDSTSYASTFRIMIDGTTTTSDPIYYYMENTKLIGMPESMLESMVIDFFESASNYIVKNLPVDNFDISQLPPYITNVYLENKDGHTVDTIGLEETTIYIQFNRDMDVTQELDVRYGSVRPFADFFIEGKYVDSRTWVGKFSVKSKFEGGIQYLSIENARANDNHALVLPNMGHCFSFNIESNKALSMNINAVPVDKGIKITWNQDDYPTIMGYNIYRSLEEDGEYVKINPQVLLVDENEFIDDNAYPGEIYYYTFTVVLTDLKESKPAPKVKCQATDTIYPTIMHTPVNQGYLNHDLIIHIEAIDNVNVSEAILYYRSVGELSFKKVKMANNNDLFSGLISSRDITLSGIEYYIEVTDGNNSTFKGSSEAPYQVIIKNIGTHIIMGDVDGNGVINTRDALIIMNAINDEIILTNDEFKRADLNGNGVLEPKEALAILSFINGNIQSLENFK